MIRGRYIVFALFCLFFFPIVTRAECSYERMAELNKIAGNVQVSYSYDPIKNGDGKLYGINSNLLFSNVTGDIYIVDELENVIDKDGMITYEFLSEVELNIYSKDSNCYGDLLLKKHISIPHINYLYYSNDCVENPGFMFCQMWLDTDTIDYDVFKKELSEYKKQINNSNNQNGDKSEFDFDFRIIVILGLIVIITITVIFILKRRRKL